MDFNALAQDSPFVAAAIIAGLASLIVGIFGTIIAMFNAWRSRVAQRVVAVAEFREKWLNEFRLSASELQGELFYSHYTEGDEGLRSRKRSYICGCRLLLMMNPAEEEHEAVRQILIGLEDADDTKDASYLANQLRELTQTVLKKEWSRLKKDLRGSKI